MVAPAALPRVRSRGFHVDSHLHPDTGLSWQAEPSSDLEEAPEVPVQREAVPPPRHEARPVEVLGRQRVEGPQDRRPGQAQRARARLERGLALDEGRVRVGRTGGFFAAATAPVALRSAAWASDAWRWAGVLAFFFLGRGSCAAAAVNASAADRLARTTARAAASLDACSFVGSGGRAWSGVTVTRAGFGPTTSRPFATSSRGRATPAPRPAPRSRGSSGSSRSGTTPRRARPFQNTRSTS